MKSYSNPGFARKVFTFMTMTAATIVLGGCASSSKLSEAGARVTIVESIAAKDVAHYENLGTIDTAAVRSVEAGRNELRNKAADRGATIVRLTSTESVYCPEESSGAKAEKNCFRLFGDAFGTKSK